MNRSKQIITIINSIPQPWRLLIVDLMAERDKAKADLQNPAVLAALPEVQAIIAGALEAAAQSIDTAGDPAVTEALGQQLCCSGDMCGCQGADVGTYLLHMIRALTPDAAIAARDAMIAAAIRKRGEG